MSDKRYTKQQLADIQKLEAMILKDVDELCRNNGIEYFVGYGTALGQRRHSGFIPWDDDIDIHMTRSNYNRFLQTAQRQMGRKYFIQHYTTDTHTPWLYAKVRLNGTLFTDWQNSKSRMHKGIYIDIFPLDQVPADKERTAAIAAEFWFVHKLYSWRINGRLSQPPQNRRDLIRGIIKYMFHILLSLFPARLFYGMYEKLLKRYQFKEHTYGFWFEHRLYAWPEHVLFPVQRGRFGDMEVNIPNNPDAYLTELYGDYMRLPPEEERAGHQPYAVCPGKYAAPGERGLRPDGRTKLERKKYDNKQKDS